MKATHYVTYRKRSQPHITKGHRVNAGEDSSRDFEIALMKLSPDLVFCRVTAWRDAKASILKLLAGAYIAQRRRDRKVAGERIAEAHYNGTVSTASAELMLKLAKGREKNEALFFAVSSLDEKMSADTVFLLLEQVLELVDLVREAKKS